MALPFLGPRRRREAAGEQVVTRVGEFVDCVGAHVMIGEHQAFRGDKSPRPAGTEADARSLQVFEPLGRQPHPVVALDQLERRGGKEPHALVADGQCCRLRQGDHQRSHPPLPRP